MNEGRLVIELAVDAVASAMEQVPDPDTASLVGVQLLTVWSTPDGLRMFSQTMEATRG